jgi:hypothetical protein
MKKNFWTSKQNDIVKRYCSDQNNIEERSKCIEELTPALQKLAGASLHSLGAEQTDDSIQDCVLHLIDEVLPQISVEKISSSFSYLYTASLWKIKSEYRHHKLKDIQCEVDLDDVSYMYTDRNDEADYRLSIEDTRKLILAEIDKKIQTLQFKIYSKPPTTSIAFLTHLKNYLISNDYDGYGFFDFVTEKMNLSKIHCYNIFRQQNIDVRFFTERNEFADNSVLENRKYQNKYYKKSQRNKVFQD